MKCVWCVGVDSSFHQLQVTFFLPACVPPFFWHFFPQQLLESMLSLSLLPHAWLPPCTMGWQRTLCVIKGLEGRISHSAAGFYPSPNKLWQCTNISLSPCSCAGPLERLLLFSQHHMARLQLDMELGSGDAAACAACFLFQCLFPAKCQNLLSHSHVSFDLLVTVVTLF